MQNRPVIALLAAIVFSGLIVFFIGPGLLHDYPLRNQQFVPAQASITDARCRTYWIVYTNCSISYRVRQASDQTQSLSYSFLGPVMEEKVRLLRPVNDQNTVVADIGINKFGNRILLFVIGLLAFASLGIFSAHKMMAEA
jgi:hypothetical protein